MSSAKAVFWSGLIERSRVHCAAVPLGYQNQQDHRAYVESGGILVGLRVSRKRLVEGGCFNWQAGSNTVTRRFHIAPNVHINKASRFGINSRLSD
jgi:hypothetical protein